MKIPESLRPAIDLLKDLAERFNTSNSGLMAAAVSFYAFLSLVPLLLVAVAVMGFFLRSPEQGYRAVSKLLQTAGLAEQGRQTLRAILAQVVRGSDAAAGFGIISLLWAGSQAFVNLERAVNTAWGCRPRGFLKGRLVAILFLFAVGALLLFSFGITTASSALRSHHIIIGGRDLSASFDWVWRLVAFLLPIAITISTFMLIYKLLPNTRVALVDALIGGAAAGVLWEAAKHVFSWYLTRFANYNAVYGSLAGLILLLLWIYYSSVVVILGAHISAISHARRRSVGAA